MVEGSSVNVEELCKTHGIEVTASGHRWSTADGHVEITFFDGSSIGAASMWGVRVGNSFISHFELELALKKAIAFGGLKK